MGKSLSVLTFLLASVLLMMSGARPQSAPAEELTGPVSRERILAHSPDWQATAAAYQPVPEALDRLRGLAREVRIEVYFGSWCSDCAARIPAFLKILDMVDSPLLRVSYTGVPRDRAKRAPFIGDRGIERVPTFIVSVGGREVGRIVESPKTTIEEDLAQILGL